MSSASELHLELLDDKQKDIYRRLTRIAKNRYLVGGTALSLQMGHRYSYDFDSFSDMRNTPRFFSMVSKLFPIGTLIHRDEDEYTFITKTGVKMTFFCYPYDVSPYCINIKPITILSVGGVAIAKAFAIGQRNRWRDYLDMYAILSRTNITLSWIALHADKTYSNEFNMKLFLGQLLYTKDIGPEEKRATELVDEKVTVKKLLDFFKIKIREYLSTSSKS
jgi:hypothetical protein